ncbi:TPA: ATP-binding protein [Escherichia coli]|uniref:ATP-binding protein n=1 Tax=Escherichia coli TaxID=562 RepID=UPI002036C080|nr:ATP-binding protein [Escherichia coli]HBB7807873.1 ATP-binding protein [Escherichia coli]
MKISYIWVDKYKGFTDFAINLASDKRFSYNQDSCSLNMMDNEDYIANLFSTKITDVTAIVGKNGVGKTNCLELICTILEGTMRQYNTSFLAIVEDDEKKYTIYHNLEQGIEANFEYKYESDKNKIKGIRGCSSQIFMITGGIILVERLHMLLQIITMAIVIIVQAETRLTYYLHKSI